MEVSVRTYIKDKTSGDEEKEVLIGMDVALGLGDRHCNCGKRFDCPRDHRFSFRVSLGYFLPHWDNIRYLLQRLFMLLCALREIFFRAMPVCNSNRCCHIRLLVPGCSRNGWVLCRKLVLKLPVHLHMLPLIPM